jgi:hypothetical protein
MASTGGDTREAARQRVTDRNEKVSRVEAVLDNEIPPHWGIDTNDLAEAIISAMSSIDDEGN